MRLLVIADGAADLRGWLAATTEPSVEIIEPSAGFVPGRNLGCGLLVTEVEGGLDVVRLPLDGPLAALDLALLGLGRRLGQQAAQAVVVPVTVDGRPPPPEVLQRIARSHLRPGVDLTGFDWVTNGAVWITGAARVTPIDRDLTAPGGSRSLAQLILDLEVFQADTPSSAWVEAVAASPAEPEKESWVNALRADYVESCVAGLRSVGHHSAM